MSPVDPYAVLGVHSTATQRELARAFRRLARAHHPDTNASDPEAERRFKRIAHAWDLVRTPARRRAFDERRSLGRFAGPARAGERPATFAVDHGPLYHSDLGHHSDFYQAGDPLTVSEAARLTSRDPSWLRRAIRGRRVPASRGPRGYLLRRRDVERLDRNSRRRPNSESAGGPPGTRPTAS
jgi:curved DNA-binding protein CbpA